MMMMKKKCLVSIVKCNDYQYENVYRSVKQSLDLIGGIKKFISPNHKVLIKPNLLAAKPPEKAVTTHPMVLKAIIELVKGAGAIPWVGESSGGVSYGLTARALEVSGLKEVIEETGAVFKNFDMEGVEKRYHDKALVLKDLLIARPVFEADFIISLPKLKTHEQILFTGAVKNMFGVVPGGGKRAVHQKAVKAEELSNALLDIYSFVKPGLSIMDAIIGMEGTGPALGTPRKIGLILASSDGIALDYVASSAVGFEPLKIKTISLGIARKIGIASENDIKTVGEPLPEIMVKDFEKPSNSVFENLPSWLVKNIVSGFQNVRPFIDNSSNCKRCMICKNSCPTDAIKVSKNNVIIAKNKCISCFCCRELCPENVFGLKRGWLSTVIYNRVYNKNSGTSNI
jgi:uncharacterized protein (DUF362 family)/Pyruvate/2-oxoacid:ferredoxin oxidoreductase delta subunit